MPGVTSTASMAQPKAVSATKKRSNAQRFLASGELCIALYRPKKLRQRIWWPALRFPSITELHQVAIDTDVGPDGNEISRKGRKKLTKKMLKESFHERPIETLCYLGRPLGDFCTADDAAKSGVEVQGFHEGLTTLTEQAKSPKFPGLLADTCSEQPPEILKDFYAAMDEATNRHSDDSDDSDSDSDEDEPFSWAEKTQEKWSNYLQRRDEFSEDEEEPVQQAPEHAHHDEVSVAQSAAAVSYTEASLMSASKAASVVSAPRLSEHTIDKEESFDSIWNKHELEGWDTYYNEDTDEMVYDAPNGCSFPSSRAFCDFLVDTYGFCGRDSPVEEQQQQQRGRSSRRHPEQRNSSRSRSRSRSRESGVNWTPLWKHLKFNLGWTYAYPSTKDQKLHGMSTTAVWFRPGFDKKHRGQPGRDHFFSEDAVVQYCQEHNIQVMPTPEKPAEEEGESSEEEMEEEDSAASSSSSTEHIANDDPGYATPDDQSTVPQDPGKPRLPTPGTNASASSGGSTYSYDNDPDRYVFSNLWQRLKSKGWAWCKAKNSLEDYWYIKPASIRPESEWIRGTDYFGTEDEVIEFCKKRDELSRKEREKRRRERRMRQEEEREALAKKYSAAEETDAKQAKPKKKKRGRSKKHTSTSEQPKNTQATYTEEKKDRNKKDKELDTSRKLKKTQVIDAMEQSSKQSLAKKRSKESNERGSKAGRKRKSKDKKKARPVGYSVEDKNLRVDFYNRNGLRRKESPWFKDLPRYEHKVCLNATNMTFGNGNYYLPGETFKSHTQRFQKPADVARHFAMNPSAVQWASGEKIPSNEDERIFERLIRYVFVPGLQSAWPEIRLITRVETSILLRKLGYKDHNGTSWEPPEALVAMGHLEQSYSSLESLCKALRSLSGDLQTPPSALTRRRKQESSITDTQLMALRLRIAEDFSESDEWEEVSVESQSTSEEDLPEKKRKRGRSRDSESEQEEQVDSSPSDENTEESENEEEQQTQLTPSEKRAKEFGEDEEQQIAMSPSKIKVGKFQKNPQDNTAPWRINPNEPPNEGWHKMYLKMGFTYNQANYYLPGESSKKYTQRFTRTEDICVYVCQEGSYEKYLDKLTSKERKLVQRHFNYGNVPGNFHEWRKLRELSTEETILFLNLLGFERNPGEYGWWQIPEGVPILEEKAYPTFSKLCKALTRLPDLEDRTMGMGRGRRSRKKEEDLVLSDYQMMALRLRIAEGFGDEAESVVEEQRKKMVEENFQQEKSAQVEEDETLVEEEINHVEEENKPLFHFTEDLFDELKCATSYEPWKAFSNLGCTYNGTYGVPGHGSKIERQQEMIELILTNSVMLLDWEHCTLDTKEIMNLVRYLKAYYIHFPESSRVEAALQLVTKANVKKYLNKIGIIERNGKYQIQADTYSESDVVNMIRRSEKLNFLRQNKSTPSKRRRSSGEELLSKDEQYSLRLWAFFIDIPLTNMPDESTIGRAQREDEDKNDSNTPIEDRSNKSTHAEECTQVALESISTQQIDSNATETHDDVATNQSPVLETAEAHLTATDQITAPPSPPEERTLTVARDDRGSPKNLGANLDSLVTLSKDCNDGKAKAKFRGDSPKKLESTFDSLVTISEEANTVRESPTVESAIPFTESLTETEMPKAHDDFLDSPIPMDSETAARSGDTNPSQRSTAFEPALMPSKATPVETADYYAQLLMQSQSQPKFGTPSPKKKRRKSKKKGRKENFASSHPKSPEASPEYFTPRQHNKHQNLQEISTFQPRITNKRKSPGSPNAQYKQSAKRKGSESPTEFKAKFSSSKTAASHSEAFGNNPMDMRTLLTQPSFGDESQNLEHMSRAASLDFDDTRIIYSPLAAVATKKLKPSQQNYASQCFHSQEEEQEEEPTVDLHTQQDGGWWDGQLM